jgi:hypothetical protein
MHLLQGGGDDIFYCTAALLHPATGILLYPPRSNSEENSLRNAGEIVEMLGNTTK